MDWFAVRMIEIQNSKTKISQNLIMDLHGLAINSYDIYDGDPE